MASYQFNKETVTLICSFSGRLDTIASLSVQEELNTELSGHKVNDHLPSDFTIIFDFQGATFISSSFIRICVSAAKMVEKNHFSIVHCDPFIKKTFKIAGLDELLNVS